MEAAIPRARVFASLLQRQFFKGILACSAAALSLSRVSPLSFLTLPSSLAHSPLPCYRVTRLSRTCIPWSSASSDNISVAPVTLLLLHVDKCLKDSTTFHNPGQPSFLPSSLRRPKKTFASGDQLGARKQQKRRRRRRRRVPLPAFLPSFLRLI